MITPWMMVRTVDNIFLQLYDLGIDYTLPNEYVSFLEYILDGPRIGSDCTIPRKVAPDGTVFFRAGLKTSITSLKENGFSDYVTFSPVLNREVSTVKQNQIVEYIDQRHPTQLLLSGKMTLPFPVATDFFQLVEMITQSSGVPTECIGVEGSMSLGYANEQSDFDILIYGQKNYAQVLESFRSILPQYPNVEMFSDSDYGHRTVFPARSFYLPLTQEEMIFHESRRPMGFIVTGDIQRKFSLVGTTDIGDPLRTEMYETFEKGYSFKPQGVTRVTATIADDRFGVFRPTYYQLNDVTVHDAPIMINPNSIRYVVDYLANFYLYCKEGERIECKAMLDEIYKDSQPTGTYRMVLSHWDNHLEHKFYLKTIKGIHGR